MFRPMRFFFPLILLITLSSFSLYAQNGQYDVRLVEHDIDCDNMLLYIDLEVKASTANNIFNIADQNFRISFNRDAFKPYNPDANEADRSVQIHEELVLSEFVSFGGTNSFYNPHTLMGSTDTILSYNIELSGGDGYPLDEANWVKVGRLSFELLDIDKCGEIWLHDVDVFPPTFVSEKLAGMLYSADEGDLITYNQCFAPICNPNQAPLLFDDYINALQNVTTSYNILFNDNDPDGNLDPSSITFISTPPASEATIELGPNQGEITVIPAPGFFGSVTPFQYQVCDNLGLCSVATVYVEVYPNPNGINDPELFSAITLYPTLAEGQVNLKFDGVNAKDQVHFTLTDLNGRKINNFEKTVNGSPVHSFNLEGLAAGHYFFKLLIDDKVVVKRFIKL